MRAELVEAAPDEVCGIARGRVGRGRDLEQAWADPLEPESFHACSDRLHVHAPARRLEVLGDARGAIGEAPQQK